MSLQTSMLVIILSFVGSVLFSSFSWFSSSYAHSIVAASSTSNSNKAVDLFQVVATDDPDAVLRAVKDTDNIDVVGSGGQTPLIRAVLTGKSKSARVLLDYGADEDLTEKDGYNIIHAAAFQGRADIAKMLLVEYNLQRLMDQHSDGFYPIHRACWGKEERHAETVDVFVEHGNVPYDIKAANGQTCMDMTKNQSTLKRLVGRSKRNEL